MLDMPVLVLADVAEDVDAEDVDDVAELLDESLAPELELELDVELEVVSVLAPGVVTAATLDMEFAF